MYLRREEKENISQTYGKSYFLKSLAGKKAPSPFTCFELYGNFRQRDPGSLETLNKIGVGRVSQYDLDSLNARARSQPPEGVIVLASGIHVVEEINNQQLPQLPGLAHVFSGDLKIVEMVDGLSGEIQNLRQN